MLKQQGLWTELQRKDLMFTNDRFAHLAHIIKTEMAREHEREARLLRADPEAEGRGVQVAVWRERVEAADRIMLVSEGRGNPPAAALVEQHYSHRQ